MYASPLNIWIILDDDPKYYKFIPKLSPIILLSTN